MILQAQQLRECLDQRANLWRLLHGPHEGQQALRQFNGAKHILEGMTDQWIELDRGLKHNPGMTGSLPSNGHVLIEACVGAEEHVLRRLLWNIEVDIERQWEIKGQTAPWSAWIWTASNVSNDGAVEKSFVEQTWNVLLPFLISSGLDLDKPTGFSPKSPLSELSRFQWLERENPAQLDLALNKAYRLSMNRDWPTPSFNSASRRL